MESSRQKKATLNVVVSLASQLVTLLCGIVIPNLMISNFGSEAYGATCSISQFLSYITLFEGGICGVARAALYGPLAKKNNYEISVIMSEMKRFFRLIASGFCIYVIVLAVSFKSISNIQCFDWISSAILVLVISISTFAQYFIGISYSVLLQADQKTYITQAVSVLTTILNTIMIVLLVHLHCSLIIVKLVSSIVFALRPLLMMLYVKCTYELVPVSTRNPDALKQKWNALGQHIAYFIHNNTDVVVLTFLSNLSTVAVYSVYHMIVSNIQNIATSFCAGMEAVFGELYAKKEYSELNKTFSFYEVLISAVAIFFYGVTAAIIVPFVQVYTRNVEDVNYIVPAFAVVLVVSSLLFCLRFPYHSMVMAAGKFKETRWASYGEALINIIVSIILVKYFGLIGVAIGTVSAVLFRFLFYVNYMTKNVLARSINLLLKQILFDVLAFSIIICLGSVICRLLIVDSYFNWLITAVLTSAMAVIVITGLLFAMYKDEAKRFFAYISKKVRRS